jgi:hypothetical protein
MSEHKGKALEPLEAELLARAISTAYANTCSYGDEHPLSLKACGHAHDALGRALERVPVITLLSDRGSLFVEKHPVGSRFNPTRLVKMLAEFDIESVSFEAGIAGSDFSLLMRILASPANHPELEDVERELDRHNVDSIRFNHIVYRKLTSDQKVVSKHAEGEEAMGPSRYAGGVAARVLHELESFMSLGRLAGEPEQAGDDLAESIAEGDDDSRRKLIDHLRRLAQEIERGGAVGASSLSPEDLFLAMNTLRQRVRQSVSARQDMETILGDEGEVIDEIDQLTYSTLISLVREEYRGSNYSALRTAQIINRMLPDPRELRRMLPQLKQALIQEGMSLRDYSELVHHLSTALRGEHLVQALEDGAEEIGLDVDEIVDRISDDPAEAARLVVLAAELRQGTGGADEDQLSAAFSDYIERVGEQLRHGGQGARTLDSRALRDQLSRLQRELIIQLDDRGAGDQAMKQLDDRLQQRVDRAFDDNRLETLDALLRHNRTLSPELVMEWLEQQLLTPSDLDHLRGSVTRIMKDHGFDADEISGMLESIAERLPDGPPMALPKGVLDAGATSMLLHREVLRARRYSTSFSVIRLTVEKIRLPDGRQRRPTSRETALLLPELYTRVLRQARDLDVVGTLDEKLAAEPLVILPMTDNEGAAVVCERLCELLAEYPFQLGEQDCHVEVTATAVTQEGKVEGQAVDRFRLHLEQAHQARRPW